MVTSLEVRFVFCFFLLVAFLVFFVSTCYIYFYENHKMKGMKEKVLTRGRAKGIDKHANHLCSLPGRRRLRREIVDDSLVYPPSSFDLFKCIYSFF